MKHFYERSGGDGKGFVAVADPGSSLVEVAAKRLFRRVFENDPEIGGRYSVLSYFGLVPAALAGVNVEAMLHRAQVAEQNCAHFDDTAATLASGRGSRWAALRYRAATRSRSSSTSRSRASASGSSS